MNDLVGTLHEFTRLFDRLGIPYAVMGGWAVRVYALPRPTYDVDFTIQLPLLKLIANRTRDRADIEDLLLTRAELDEPYLRRWAGPLGVEAKLDDVLAARE